MTTARSSRRIDGLPLRRLAAGALLAWGASQASAATVTLCAEPFTVDMPSAAGTLSVTMWGYRALDPAVTAPTAAACDNPPARSSTMSPLITVPAGDSTLEVTLVNRLNVPTSLVVAGQSLPTDATGKVTPVMAADVFGSATCDPVTDPLACRVRSFTYEVMPGAVGVYRFTNLRPGTYLYQSGTHPQVQVQMGLHGMLRQDAPPTDITARRLFTPRPADANVSGFDVDVPVLLSEIDPDQHALIARTLGTAGQEAQWKTGGNSTLNYAPRYFLINGKVYQGTSPTTLPVSAPVGARVVLRVANAGLQSRTLMLNGGTWKLLTEDGFPYVAPREQATLLMPAGKTSDALMLAPNATPAAGTTGAALFDRRAGTDNGDASPLGGQVATLAVTNTASVNHPPVVNAGPDVTVTQSVNLGPTTVSGLYGSVTDDGPYTANWITPAGITFSPSGPPVNASFDATFANPGVYTLRLTAKDQDFTVVDDMVVTVKAPPTADLAITQTDSRLLAAAGVPTSYRIVVSNNGPDPVVDATVVDTLPSGMSAVSWTCVTTPGSSCASAGGSAALNTTVSLLSGGSATFVLTGTPAAGAGPLSNTVSASVPATVRDPVSANNAATDVDALLPLPVLDNFDRANATNLGSAWVQTNSALRINTNQAFGNSQGIALWAATLGARQAAAFTLAGATATPISGNSLILKATSDALGTLSYLRVRINNTTLRVIVESTVDSGANFTPVGQPLSLSVALAVGDALIAAADESGAVEVWRQPAVGVAQYLGVRQSIFTGVGRIGMRLVNDGRVDNFSGGNLP